MIATSARPATEPSASAFVASTSAAAALKTSRIAFDRGEHLEGDRLARVALVDAVAAGDQRAQQEAWDLIALHADRRGEMALVASAAEEALALLPRDAVEARARLHCRLARVFAVLELDASNLQHATEAVAAARASGQTELICLALSRLGTAVGSTGDWSRAGTLVKQALVLARAEGNAVETVRALSNLAAVLYYTAAAAARRGDAEAAAIAARDGLRAANDAIAFRPANPDAYATLTAQVNRSLLLVQAGHCEEALAGCAAVDEVARRHGYREILVKLEFTRGKAIALLGDHQQGVALLEGMITSMGDEDPAIRGRLHEELYTLYKNAGDLGRALAHHESLLGLERARAVRRSNAQYGLLLERAEVQRTRLDAERAQREAELQRLRAIRMQGELDVMEARAAEMGRHALEDALTGLPNRRRIEDAMQKMFAEAGATQGTISVALVDIDHFKIVNDTFGHAVGDDVIRAVGKLLAQELRDVDLVGRHGGEEFVLLLPRTSVETATVTADRVRRAIESHDWAALRPSLAVTVSIGLCFMDRPCLPRHALERADAALYGAKAAGRNRVVVESLACGSC